MVASRGEGLAHRRADERHQLVGLSLAEPQLHQLTAGTFRSHLVQPVDHREHRAHLCRGHAQRPGKVGLQSGAVVDPDLHFLRAEPERPHPNSVQATWITSASATALSLPSRSTFHWKKERPRPRCGRS